MKQSHRLKIRALSTALTGVLLLAAAGCETTGLTSMEASKGAYDDARSFLQAGTTTQAHVTRKYGQPQAVEPWQGGELWQYSRSETILLNAYTGTPLGTEGAVIAGQGGFQQTVERTTRMQLYFDRAGVLSTYSIQRDAP